VADVTLPEMIAGCHGDEEPEVYTGKTAFVSSFCSLSARSQEQMKRAPLRSEAFKNVKFLIS